MKKILTEPLLHFFLIGLLLFFVFEVLNKSENQHATIEITANEIDVVRSNFVRTWQRQPTDEEVAGLVEEKVKDELAYREALALGFDKGDSYVRRRMRMKVELLMEDLSQLNPVTSKELRLFLEEHKELFVKPAKIAFAQIYFDPGKHVQSLDAEIKNLKEKLNSMDSSAQDLNYGDPLILPQSFPLTPVAIIKRQFGNQFGEKILKLDQGKWVGPIPSTYGVHLVYIGARNEGYLPELEDIWPEVEREFMTIRRERLKEEAYEKMRQQYDVRISPFRQVEVQVGG